MTVFITGMTGFVGRHLAEHSLACNDAVMGTSIETGRDRPLANVDCLPWDIRDAPSARLQNTLEDFAPDVIYHLAALSTPAECGEAEATPAAFSINVEGTRRVCELAATLHSRPRVVFISSGRVYEPVDPQSPHVDESAPTPAMSAYAKMKVLAEEQVKAICGDAGLPFIIARAFNHTGPGQLPPLMLPQWCEQLARGDATLHVRNPNVWMDLCDVRDVVRAYRLLALTNTANRMYNVGSGQAIRTGDVAERLIDVSSRNVTPAFDDQTEHHNAIADIGRLQDVTHWSPEITLEQTIRDTWKFWLERVPASD